MKYTVEENKPAPLVDELFSTDGSEIVAKEDGHLTYR